MKAWLRTSALGACIVLALGATRPVSAQVQVESSAAKIEFGGRVQLQAATSSCSDYTNAGTENSACEEDAPGLDTFIRRVRLTMDVEFNEWISARFQPEFGKVNSFRLADAYGRLNLSPGSATSPARLTLGHFKRPFDLFALASSTQMLMIERGVSARGLSTTSFGDLTVDNRWSDRDVGVMIDGGTAGDMLHYWFGVFNGGTNSDNEDDGGKQYVGRAQVKLTRGEMPLKFGVAGTLNNQPYLMADESLATKGYGAWEIFAEVGDYGGGAHVQASYIGGKNSLQNPAGDQPDLVAGDDFATLSMWQAVAGWKFEVDNSWFEAIQPIFRVTRANPNTDLENQSIWGFTPGVQFSFDDDRRAENAFRVQYQFHF